jgi:hypothetical protein
MPAKQPGDKAPQTSTGFPKRRTLAWRLLIGGADPDSKPDSRFVVFAPTVEEAIYLFKRRGVVGVSKRCLMRSPELDRPPTPSR